MYLFGDTVPTEIIVLYIRYTEYFISSKTVENTLKNHGTHP